MPAFLVHGVPDSEHLWDAVRSHLERQDVIAPSMPGFGAPLPDGFDCTKDAYVSWLIARVEKAGAPVDIVGHDWGSILVQRLVSLRPDLVRTWAAGGGPLDTAYEWHATAKTWQTPNAGEQLMASWTPEVLANAWPSLGVDAETAKGIVGRIDETMKSAILALYRSATRVSEDWAMLASPCPPGLVLWGADDPFAPAEFGRRLAERTGAQCAVFEGCAHWWPLQRPAETAAALEDLWAR